MEPVGTKWSCVACTYLNWPHDTCCLQCETRRRRPSPTGAAGAAGSHSPSPSSGAAGGVATLHEALAPLSIGAPSVDSVCGRRRLSLAAARCVSPSPRSSTRRQESPPHHWVCMSCTCDNLSTTRHCVMCGQRRGCDPSATEFNSDAAGAAGITTSLTPRHHYLQQLPHVSAVLTNYEVERRLRRARRRHRRDADWAWLNACVAAVEGQLQPVRNYLSTGGDPTRQLNKTEVALLNRPSVFESGLTLVHLALRFCQDHVVDAVLSTISPADTGVVKRVPCYVVPDLAQAIRRSVTNSLRQRRAHFACHFLSDLHWFALPYEIEFLPEAVQQQLWNELLDREAQQQLEVDEPVINWCAELTERLGSRLHALWNRSAGDCLLDSVMQSTCGVFDRDGALRRALFDSLNDASSHFYPRWRDHELSTSAALQFDVCDEQLRRDWRQLLTLNKPGAPLEQLHVWALTHILRRPIVIYGVKFVKSFRGETIDFARFEGVYLPMLWDSSFCSKSPLCLGYTRGHFCSLVPVQPPMSTRSVAGDNYHAVDPCSVVFYPLMSHDSKLLPVHFLTRSERGCEELLLRQWLDVCITDAGYMVAQCRLPYPPLLVAQLLQEWLNHYRSLCPAAGSSLLCRLPPVTDDVSSENDSAVE